MLEKRQLIVVHKVFYNSVTLCVPGANGETFAKLHGIDAELRLQQTGTTRILARVVTNQFGRLDGKRAVSLSVLDGRNNAELLRINACEGDTLECVIPENLPLLT